MSPSCWVVGRQNIDLSEMADTVRADGVVTTLREGLEICMAHATNALKTEAGRRLKTQEAALVPNTG